jgi:hypothetical protein
MSRQKRPLSKRLLAAALVVVLLPLLLPLVVLVVILALLHGAALGLLVRLVWLPRGKDVLLVYSDSPIWHDYMVNEILPLVAERAVVLNWSERRKWGRWSLAAYVFRTYGGRREYNPMVLVFRPMGRAKVFRFWRAFQDQKHGYLEPLQRMRQDLFLTL